jgi:hypothetical protein
MYTVFRLSSENYKTLMNAKTAFHEISPDLLRNTKYEGSMACGVYKGQDWADHRNKIIQFIERFKEIFDAFHDTEISFSFDMAVYQGDTGDSFYCSFPLDSVLLSLLYQNKIGFEFTAYYPLDDIDEGDEIDEDPDDSDGE